MILRTRLYAKWYERCFAYLLDQVGTGLLTGVMIMLAVMLGLMKIGGTPEAPVLEQSSFVVMFLCLTAYHTIAVASNWQATPGQRLMHIHIVRTDGRKLTQAMALERFLAYILPTLPFYTSFIPQDVVPMLVVWLSVFWFMPILFTPEHTGVHDRICGTRVVKGKAGA
jgi:uncharacterized RDD family membrane protein YckC